MPTPAVIEEMHAIVASIRQSQAARESERLKAQDAIDSARAVKMHTESELSHLQSDIDQVSAAIAECESIIMVDGNWRARVAAREHHWALTDELAQLKSEHTNLMTSLHVLTNAEKEARNHFTIVTGEAW